ncbi:MBL fold metallo-hydrolase [Leucothrix arctica]|uniref:Metallo-beta-lactamase domain-containing protein n=1 Tax=Leucothrix arctica TaxID=1481894 RepID=A0A317CC44_9GAMM|nr:MBL fold metallo-hydrolase [Leucothrix arctica]PWQ95671.1 hypothetical protein DKT75_11595 [Leucothrix arctica]
MFKLITAVLVTSLLSISPSFAADRAITKVAGDVYRFQNKFHFSIFVVTDKGVVVTDPINAEAASWLKSEISKITDKPITHLIYSHSHGDHASGGAAFGDIPTIIAHKNAPEKIDGVEPTILIDGVTTVKVGGKTIELTPLGPGHGADLIAMVVQPENVGFVVDAVASKRLPYRNFPNSNVDDWTDQVRKVESLDFEIFAGGHGPIGVKADVTEGRVYLEELREQVLQGLKSGKTVEELEKSISMGKYKDWASFSQWRGLNVQGMARHLTEIGAVK